jgi:F-type H+-transporting ATPase subunit b
MTFSWSTFALQAFNFLVLVWVLKRFLFKPIRTIVAQRKAEITRVQEQAQAAGEKAEQARKDFQLRQSQLEAERQRIMDEAHAALDDERSRMIEAARSDIEKLKSAALKQLDEERESAARDVLDKTVQVAVQLAENLLQQFSGPKLDEIILEQVLQHLDHLTETERAALLSQLGRDGGQLIVTTASALDAEHQSMWRAALAQRLGGSPRIDFTIDKDLIAGTELKFPHAVLHFNWRRTLAQAQGELNQSELNQNEHGG